MNLTRVKINTNYQQKINFGSKHPAAQELMSSPATIFINKDLNFKKQGLMFKNTFNQLRTSFRFLTENCEIPACKSRILDVNELFYFNRTDRIIMKEGQAIIYLNLNQEINIVLIPYYLVPKVIIFSYSTEKLDGYYIKLSNIFNFLSFETKKLLKQKDILKIFLWLDGSISKSDFDILLNTGDSIVINNFIQNLILNEQKILNYDLYYYLFIKNWFKNINLSKLDNFKFLLIHSSCKKYLLKTIGSKESSIKQLKKLLKKNKLEISNLEINTVCLGFKFYAINLIKKFNKISSSKYLCSKNNIQKRSVINHEQLFLLVKKFSKINHLSFLESLRLMQILEEQPSSFTKLHDSVTGLLRPRPFIFTEDGRFLMPKDLANAEISKKYAPIQFLEIDKLRNNLSRQINIIATKSIIRHNLPLTGFPQIEITVSKLQEKTLNALEAMPKELQGNFNEVIVSGQTATIECLAVPKSVYLPSISSNNNYIGGLSQNPEELNNLMKECIYFQKPTQSVSWVEFSREQLTNCALQINSVNKFEIIEVQKVQNNEQFIFNMFDNLSKRIK
jgi:hypothetical protein